jgi:hypothetical protein
MTCDFDHIVTSAHVTCLSIKKRPAGSGLNPGCQKQKRTPDSSTPLKPFFIPEVTGRPKTSH